MRFLHRRLAAALLLSVSLSAPILLLLVAGGLLGSVARDAVAAVAGEAGLRVRSVVVSDTRANADAVTDIRQVTDHWVGRPLLGIAPQTVKDEVEALGWVQDVRVTRLLPETLSVEVTSRPMLAVWQHEGRLSVVDEAGEVIPEADSTRFEQLPLIVGAGANRHFGAFLPLLADHPIRPHVRAFVRIDDRRWDLHLDNGGVVQLPALGAEASLARIADLDRKAGLLSLGFERIDLRSPGLLVLRPGPRPVPPST